MQSSADNPSQNRRIAIAQSAKHQWTLRGSANSQENSSNHVDFFETRANHIYGPNTAIAADTKLLSLLPSPKGMKDLSLAVDRILPVHLPPDGRVVTVAELRRVVGR